MKNGHWKTKNGKRQKMEKEAENRERGIENEEWDNNM